METSAYARLSGKPNGIDALFGLIAPLEEQLNFTPEQLGSITIPVLIMDGLQEEIIYPAHTLMRQLQRVAHSLHRHQLRPPDRPRAAGHRGMNVTIVANQWHRRPDDHAISLDELEPEFRVKRPVEVSSTRRVNVPVWRHVKVPAAPSESPRPRH